MAINTKKINDPYVTKKYVSQYNNIWVFPKDVKKSVDIEVRILEDILKNKSSWLDTACGTGYHLQQVTSKVKKSGVDKSESMLDYARKNLYDVSYYKQNIVKGLSNLGKYDLVSNLGYGYVHQKNLLEVLKFFESISNAVDIGGDLLIGYNNPGNWIPKDNEFKNTFGNVTFKAVIWDYYENDTNSLYRNCISPHKNLIIDTVGFDYEEIIEIELPTVWKKNVLLFKRKREN